MNLDVKLIGYVIITGLAIGAAIAGVMKTKFMTKKDCETHQHLCSIQVCKKIDTLTDKINDIKKSRTEELKVLYEFIGEVKQFMKDHSD